MLDRFASWFVASRIARALTWRPALIDRLGTLFVAQAFGVRITWAHLTGRRGVNEAETASVGSRDA